MATSGPPVLHRNGGFPRSKRAPYIYYRVEDADSRAIYIDDKGIFAEEFDTPGEFELFEDALLRYHLEQHLDWGNRNPTPFISMYSDRDVAWREANRRVKAGKRDVRIYKVNTRKSGERVEYRNIRGLADRLDFDILDQAWNNSMYEYVFLHYVPDDAIVNCWELQLEYNF